MPKIEIGSFSEIHFYKLVWSYFSVGTMLQMVVTYPGLSVKANVIEI